jgi:hypothetical protein
MTEKIQDELTCKPSKPEKKTDMPDQATEPKEKNEIDVHLDAYTDIYYSLEKQELVSIKNAVTPNSVVPDKGSDEANLNMMDLVQCFDALWPPEKSNTDATGEINPSKSDVKVLDEGEIK